MEKSKYPKTRDYLFSIGFLDWAEVSGIKDYELNDITITASGRTADEMEEHLNG